MRRKGGLGKDEDQAVKRAQQLAAIDPDWDCPWPLNWQRHYRVLADLVEADGHLPYIAGGVVYDGVWVSNTKSRRDKLTAEQLEALRKLGVEWA